MTTASKTNYSVIWKYKVKYDSTDQFEFEYGPNGTWNKLFSQSKNYKGSFLHKSEDDSQTYILIDTWVSKQAYEDFINENQKVYNEISAGFEILYLTEKKVGSFNLVS
ncbi:antibiotic biosynthesis monooxygenase family protein [Fulvivirga lutimaris]|uniref:antibiotic biosynthesis monooxygenase family protein n=1 Tax=Fulvivirga lutimaris TaxID=1819566 RepID=UPI0012BB9749|nr:hypothetical protein [Fulvivirga lutimaris]MTI40248.1 hypothetical protein [Fulvivirga lutimaris]